MLYAKAAELFESLGPDAREDWVWSVYKLAAVTEDFEEKAELYLSIVDEPTLSEYIPGYLKGLAELFGIQGNFELTDKMRLKKLWMPQKNIPEHGAFQR